MRKKVMDWHEKKHYNMVKYCYGVFYEDFTVLAILTMLFSAVSIFMLKHNIIPVQYLQFYCGAGMVFNTMTALIMIVMWLRMMSWAHSHM